MVEVTVKVRIKLVRVTVIVSVWVWAVSGAVKARVRRLGSEHGVTWSRCRTR